MTDENNLIPKHGGYRALKSFNIARLIFDITFRFCNKYVPKGSRTHDQMVQAARSGTQNIAEGSQASGTSKKTEIKLTNVARASLEELSCDFEDFLRQRNLTIWDKFDHRRQELVKNRFETADDFAIWSKEIAKRSKIEIAEAAANGLLCLISVAGVLLGRQINAQARAFEQEGGFTEKLYKTRFEARKKNNGQNGQNGPNRQN